MSQRAPHEVVIAGANLSVRDIIKLAIFFAVCQVVAMAVLAAISIVAFFGIGMLWAAANS